MFDRMVVALDGSIEAAAAGRMALRVAAKFSSAVTAVSVIDVRVVEGPAVETLAPLWGEVTGRPFQPELMRLYRERANAVVRDFAEVADHGGVTTVDRRVEIGVAEDTILEQATLADLIVMGRRGEHALFGKKSAGATLWRVLHRSPCPVLVGAVQGGTKGMGNPDDEGSPVAPLMAWDCSPGGMAGLRLAIKYASAREAPLRVVHAGDESADDRLDEAHAILAASGVEWESARLCGRPEDAVAEATSRWRADCLFMGAFGRGRIRNLLFGSHTAEILERFPGPVFVTP